MTTLTYLFTVTMYTYPLIAMHFLNVPSMLFSWKRDQDRKETTSAPIVRKKKVDILVLGINMCKALNSLNLRNFQSLNC